MAVKKVKTKLKVAGQILVEFAGTHHLDESEDFQQALELLDQAVYELEPAREDLTSQVDGETAIFQTQQPFSNIRVVLNGLEQSEGMDADYVVPDSTHIQFYRPLKQNETLKTEYTRE